MSGPRRPGTADEGYELDTPSSHRPADPSSSPFTDKHARHRSSNEDEEYALGSETKTKDGLANADRDSRAGDGIVPSVQATPLAISPDDPTVPRAEDDDGGVPDGGYGWVIVVCNAMCNAATWGVNTTYGVFQSYYIANNYYNASVLDYAWVGGLSVAVALFVAPLSNYLIQKTHYKVPMVLGAVCIVLGQCLAGVVTTFGPFLACQGVVFGAGLGFIMVPSIPVLAHWFDRRLALAQGLGAAGSGLGGLIMANAVRAALERWGVRWALIMSGLYSCALLLPAIFFFKGRHKAVGARSAPYQMKWLVHRGYVWVLLWAFFAMIAYFIAIYSMAAMATDGLGLSQTQGAALQSILGAGQMLGRPLWGLALDRGGRINMTILCYIICGLSCLVIWLPARSFGIMILFALVQGLTGGTVWSAASPISARVVGVKDLASAMSVFWLSLVLPALVGQPMAIALRDYSLRHLGREGAEAYHVSIGFCGGMGLASAGLLYGAKWWLQGSPRLWQKT